MKQAVKTKAAVDQAPRLQSRFVKRFRRDWQLHLLILIPVIYLIIFKYIPMYGAQIAFRDYRIKAGIWGSEWVGLKYFKKFFGMPDFWEIMLNTVILSGYSLATFPIPILMALLINVMRNEKSKKVIQTVSQAPHFISVVVLVAILNQVFSPINGLYGGLFRLLGGEGYPADIRTQASAFPHMYVWSASWQQTGWNTIIYLASLSAVSNELHEAAQIDGATRWKRVLNIDLPTVTGTIGIMLILRCGHVLNIGFEKVFLMQNDLNLSTSEVISTYVYKYGLGKAEYSFGAAVGLFNSIVNVILLLTVNKISSMASQGDVSLF